MSTSAPSGALSEREARILWSWIAEPADPAVNAFIAVHGHVGAAERVRAGQEIVGHDLRPRLASFDRSALGGVMQALRIRVVTPGDEEWPERLGDLDRHADLGSPHVLYARGAGHLGSLLERSVAIVGARAATEYGVRIAAELGEDVSSRGFTVVSGAAFGIDAAAHRGTLSGGHPTVAVLACGVDRAYPTQHAALLSAIAEDGVVVSEAPPGYAPFRSRFLARNRLIAAMTLGTVVVEAAIRSGSLSTARKAEQLGRAVAAVPGPVTSMASSGCHSLIRGGAMLVADATEVADLCGRLGSDAAPRPQADPEPQDLVSVEGAKVLEAIGRRGVVYLDDVVARTGLNQITVVRALAELVVDGHLVESNLGYRQVRRPAATR